jgi:hypothetical protein
VKEQRKVAIQEFTAQVEKIEDLAKS